MVEDGPLRSDIDDEENLPLINAKVDVLAGAILISGQPKNLKENSKTLHLLLQYN